MTRPSPFTRAVTVVFVALACASALHADPADKIKLLKESKLIYEIHVQATKPVAALEELTCPRRSFTQRVVKNADGQTALTEWRTLPEAAKAFGRAEQEFKNERYDEAEKAYRRALVLDPEFGLGWLYLGDVSFGRKDYKTALEHYRKALAIDPTSPQAHRFAADALRRLSDPAGAEAEYVTALAEDPGYTEAEDALRDLGRTAGFEVHRHPFPVTTVYVGKLHDGKVEVGLELGQKDGPGPAGAAYTTCKAVWRYEDGFRATQLGEQAPYSWTVAEEHDCVVDYMIAAINAADAKLEEQDKAHGRPAREHDNDELLAAASPELRFLVEVTKANALDGFILFEILGARCPAALSTLSDDAHAAVEDYVRRFVVTRRP